MGWHEPESFDAPSSPAASSRGPVLALGLLQWTALPLQASVGSKLRTAARGLTLRLMSECGRCGFRWRRCGPSSPQTGNGISARMLRGSKQRRHPGLRGFRGSMAGLCPPLPTLRRRPYGRQRTARGRCGSLLLHRSGLAPPTPCRSPGALRVSHAQAGSRVSVGFSEPPVICRDCLRVKAPVSAVPVLPRS